MKLRHLIDEARELLERSPLEVVHEKGALIARSTRITRSGRSAQAELKKKVGKDEMVRAIPPKELRDGKDEFHITLLNPTEVASTQNIEQRAKDFGIPEDWSVVGLGKIEQGSNRVYFAVLNWPGGREFRKSLGFTRTWYPHITLGFTEKDVHDVPKDRSTLIKRA